MQSPVEAEKPSRCLLCLGFGRVAEAFATSVKSSFQTIRGTTRDPAKAAAMQALGIEALGLPEALSPERLKGVTHLLLSIPPDDGGDPAWRIAGNYLAHAAPHLEWIAYLSTTGVYGDLGGRWAMEWSPAKPQSVEATRRVHAEAQWLGFGEASGVPVQVFRLPGLYGPGRAAFDRLRDGTARRIVKPGQIFSRAHEADVASALRASMKRPNAQRVYNICDDEPAPPQDIIAFAAGLMGIAPPPEIPIEAANLSPMAMRFYSESKRVSNARAKAELGWRPAFATYREGLTAIWADGKPAI